MRLGWGAVAVAFEQPVLVVCAAESAMSNRGHGGHPARREARPPRRRQGRSGANEPARPGGAERRQVIPGSPGRHPTPPCSCSACTGSTAGS